VSWYHLSPNQEAEMAKKYMVDLKTDEQEIL